MKSKDKNREEMLLLATVILNFVTELPEYKQFLKTAKEKGLKFDKGKRESFIAQKVHLSESTIQDVLYGSAKITTQTFDSIMSVKEFRELSEKIYEGIQNNDKEIMNKITNIIEHRIENKEFPKILEKMKKSENRHYALPMLLQNEQLLTKVLDYLPLTEKIFESEDTITIFSQVAERLPLFRIVQDWEDWEDWDNVENFIRSVQERNGFDNYLD
ncbi:epsilon-antitoxin [Streptococcus pluranimalium]|uniref:Epsilon-antitoxin n=2 Tax=Streptococcus pluranimalium TaxID=82348 RepID=A0A2L0D6W8_9STRE|nr:epsilon-antitoxin [Streptococcus pluranimalium]